MKRCLILLLSFYAGTASAQDIDNPLVLRAAIQQATINDPWLNGSRHRQNALNAESVSAASLPDPRVSLSANNFPVDTFDINQEAMTQLSVGISQMFPRGRTLALSSQQKRELAEQEPFLRQERKAKVRATVTRLWLEAFKAQESIRLIEHDRSLFEQLVDAAKASYSSAIGRTRQQDLVRAQLELTRIDDRLTALRQQQEANLQRLSEWVGSLPNARLPTNLPELGIHNPQEGEKSRTSMQALYEQVYLHPVLRALDQRIGAMETGVDLARQKYKPEWGLTAQYGYRDEDPMGRERADLFSVGIIFDLPVFTGNRQDKEVNAAISRAEALRTERMLLARQLVAELDTAISQLERLDERSALYNRQLLPQMAEQAEASLAAYNNDDGDFAEAVRARIAELNAKIDALGIAVERLQVITHINYLLAGMTDTNSPTVE